MNLFPYASAIALSFVVGLLSLAFILDFMQFTMKPSIDDALTDSIFLF